MLVDIDKVIVGNRIRKDFGDIQELADDIRENGLINPILISREYHLLAGERRLAACRLLGWNIIDADMYDPDVITKNNNIEIANSKFSSRRKYSKNDVRKMLPSYSSSDRQACFICGKHESITEYHHVVQVSELADYLNCGIIGVEDVSTPVVWLCPNCHAYVHAILRGNQTLFHSFVTIPEYGERLIELIDSRNAHLKYLSSKNG